MAFVAVVESVSCVVRRTLARYGAGTWSWIVPTACGRSPLIPGQRTRPQGGGT